MFMQFIFSYLVNRYPPPPRQRFHLVDKLITAREFNEFSTCGYKNPLGACTVHLYYSDASHALYAVPRVRIQSEVYFGL